MTQRITTLSVLLALSLAGAAPTQAQVPAPTRAPQAEWSSAAVAIEAELNASVVELEDSLRAAQVEEQWSRVDCGLVRLSALRTLRDTVSEARVQIDAAARAGRESNSGHHWQSIVAARLHGEVLVIEAAECGDSGPSTSEKVVVRVTGPAWDADVDYGAPAAQGTSVTVAVATRRP